MPKAPRSSLTGLFLGTAGLLRSKWQPVLIGMVSFAMLLAISSAAAERRTAAIEKEFAAALSMDEAELRDEVDRQLQELGRLSFAEFLTAVENRSDAPTIGAEAPRLRVEDAGLTYAFRVMPTFLLLLLFHAAVMFVAGVFFLLLFTAGKESAYETSKRLPVAIIRMAGLNLWILIRSWIWLPFVGPFLAIYRMPRLVLAPVILASGEEGIFRSTNRSLERTKGRWMGVFLRLLCITIVGIAILWPCLVIASAVALFSLKIGFFLWLLSIVFLAAYAAAAMTVMGAVMS